MASKSVKKIFITGGHYTPARAVIDILQKSEDWEIYYLGRKYAMEGEKAEALEYKELSLLPYIHFLVLTTGRLQRNFFVNIGQSIKALSKIFIGIPLALWWLIIYRPKIVLSFGGYIALPVVICAWLLDIPVITHEQTVVSGLSNEIISLLAKKILVSWESSLSHFPAGKAILTGNPLRQEILTQKVKKRTELKNILITGGNQGSHAINLTIEQVLDDLRKKFRLIHQTGSSQYQDFERLEKKQSEKYVVKASLSAQEMAQALASSDLVISRSGANIVTEIIYCGVPAILIPFPNTQNNEQEKNAQMLAGLGLAKIISQENLSGSELLKIISEVQGSYVDYSQSAFEARKIVSRNASDKIVSEINKLVDN